jgi:putative N-acetyltransferase (TIGR04045 family)
MTASIQRPDAPPLRHAVDCRVATSADDLRAHWQVRHDVFVSEQRVFGATDQDASDTDDRTVHCIGVVRGRIVGAVRLYPLDSRGCRWQGDRLAVLPGFRSAGIGAPLVRLAVSIAKARGGQHMVAHVQLENVRFFEHLGWRKDGPVETYVGIPHQPMIISW